eukprot:scaffold911_cov361-Prasinococcus_capsulatus_cf.AAC.18
MAPQRNRGKLVAAATDVDVPSSGSSAGAPSAGALGQVPASSSVGHTPSAPPRALQRWPCTRTDPPNHSP